MKRSKIKLVVLTILATVGIVASTASAGACWFFTYYQRECPKSLLK